MWRLYCRDGEEGQGLALRTTLGRLEDSVAGHDLYVSPVTYRRYHIGPAFNDGIDPFMHKRQGFEHEREVRLLKFDEDYFRAANAAISSDEDIAPALPAEPPEYIYVDWSLAAVIQAIVVSPYASEIYEANARHQIAAIDPSLAARIELSVLSERRYPPLR